ncbi:MAG: hypothetical protein KJ077_10395 [Anaerolineae bacterium]|nr:hypothetical protein [Anaerolineae bacterium]
MIVRDRWRIATTQGGLARGYFRFLGLPMPYEPVYKDYADQKLTSVGGQFRTGFANLTMPFRSMTATHLALIMSYIDAAVAGDGYTYLTIDRNDGRSAGPDWVDVKGIPHYPTYSPYNGSDGQAVQGVVWFINDIQVLTDPAVFT